MGSRDGDACDQHCPDDRPEGRFPTPGQLCSFNMQKPPLSSTARGISISDTASILHSVVEINKNLCSFYQKIVLYVHNSVVRYYAITTMCFNF